MAILSPVVRPVHPGPWVTSRFLARKVPCCQVEYLGHFSIGGTWSWAGHEFVGVGADAGGAPDGVVGGVGGGGGQVGGEERVGEVGGGGWRGSLKFERGVVPANERHYHRKIHWCKIETWDCHWEETERWRLWFLEEPETSPPFMLLLLPHHWLICYLIFLLPHKWLISWSLATFISWSLAPFMLLIIAKWLIWVSNVTVWTL